ncbi:DNA topoisomerase 3 [Trichomonascus vanleenenianus]|uniref:DNA topoisomerase 3 n=1 Tax=Trichomonascus vanleenenianus TaxID=2268995 RepID=UPI003EC9EAD2
MKILCVAEKPSVAKAIKEALSGGRSSFRNITGDKHVKNYDFDYIFRQWGPCNVTVTSVKGHIKSIDFDDRIYGWGKCDPRELFEAPTIEKVLAEPIARNIRAEAAGSAKLFIWTDCDREGESIGYEIMKIAQQGNRAFNDMNNVRRAIFNNVDPTHLKEAANRPSSLDLNQVEAVAGRSEIDLRIGAALTRFTTGLLQSKFYSAQQTKSPISYGGCQFPTLGFVVDRYKKVVNFKPEPFWYIEVAVTRDRHKVKFNWDRVKHFNRLVVAEIFRHCMETSYDARIAQVVTKPTSKYRPLPLTTVELQKQGARFLKMSSKTVLDVAESLYTKGYVSYPRTETNTFAPEIDLRGLVGKQTNDRTWGAYATGLLENDGFEQPRRGNKDDKAHPPIHPVKGAGSELSQRERIVYEFIARHFLACCSKNAVGVSTKVVLDWCGQRFTANGVVVLERNFLDIYPYVKWETAELPEFTQGEMVQLAEATMQEGKTSAPKYLSEPELIALMDANGIGTDATMADHIEKILAREYVTKVKPPRARNGASDDTNGTTNSRSSGGRTSNEVFIPTRLGMTLVDGYDSINFNMSLSKPFLRKQMEQMMDEVSNGTLTKQQFVMQSLDMFRQAYALASRNKQSILDAADKYAN